MKHRKCTEVKAENGCLSLLQFWNVSKRGFAVFSPKPQLKDRHIIEEKKFNHI